MLDSGPLGKLAHPAPKAADPKELDCDVILAAQASLSKAIVATENVGHLGRYVTASHWRKIVVA